MGVVAAAVVAVGVLWAPVVAAATLPGDVPGATTVPTGEVVDASTGSTGSTVSTATTAATDQTGDTGGTGGTGGTGDTTTTVATSTGTTSATTTCTAPGGCDLVGSPKADPCARDDQTGSPQSSQCVVVPEDGLAACLDQPPGSGCAPYLRAYGRDCAATASKPPWCAEHASLLLLACGALTPGTCTPALPGLQVHCHDLAAGATDDDATHCTDLGLTVGPPPVATDTGGTATNPVEPGGSGAGPTPAGPRNELVVAPLVPGPGQPTTPAPVNPPVVLSPALGTDLATGPAPSVFALRVAATTVTTVDGVSSPATLPTSTSPAAVSAGGDTAVAAGGGGGAGARQVPAAAPGGPAVVQGGLGLARLTDARDSGPLLGWPAVVVAGVLVLLALRARTVVDGRGRRRHPPAHRQRR